MPTAGSLTDPLKGKTKGSAGSVFWYLFTGPVERRTMEIKTSWWKLTIKDYPNYEPNDADLEHIAEMIKQGYNQGELIQEIEDERKATSTE